MAELGPRLADDVLARRHTLPRKPDAVTLTGPNLELLPLDVERDAEVLHAVSNGQPCRWGDREVGAYDADELVWRYINAGPFADAAALASYLRSLIDAPDGLCLCVTDARSGLRLGAVNFMANTPEHLKVELGGIWYGPVAQGTAVNTEATYLMLDHAFGLGYRRVEWKCDAFNRRSRKAAERLGFTFEGIHEAHVIVKGRNRDTAWFRMLDAEWPAIRAQPSARPYCRS